jgi:hypothetical protein
MKLIIRLVCLFSLLSNATFASQGITTIMLASNTNRGDVLSINDQQVAYVKTFMLSCSTCSGVFPDLLIQKGASVFPLSYLYFNPYNNSRELIVAGPATISITNNGSTYSAFATIDVQPAAYPPDKAVTVGAYSGNVKVTMEMSTDLANWTPAVNASVYTNSPDARFFRIRMATNASP